MAQLTYTITINGTVYSVDENDSLLVNSTGLYNSTKSTQIYTFVSTGGRFRGFNTSSGQSSPSNNYKINDTFTASSNLTLYSVEQQPAKTFNLSSLSLEAGSHTISVKAAAKGHGKSVASNILTYSTSGGQVLKIYNMDQATAGFDIFADDELVAQVINPEVISDNTIVDNILLDTNGDQILANDGQLITTESESSGSGSGSSGDSGSSVPQLISFSVNWNSSSSISFQAESGMTWGEWVASNYNLLGYFVDEEARIACGNRGKHICLSSNSGEQASEDIAVHSYDLIIANAFYDTAYTAISTHSGGSNE